MKSLISLKIENKNAKIAVLGLGYVGLSIFDAFGSKGFEVIGYDINKNRIAQLHECSNYIKGVNLKNTIPLLLSGKCRATDDANLLNEADVFILAVPTSLDNHAQPDLSKLHKAAMCVRDHLKAGTLVIVQSTSFPGTTETEILPILEQSKLKVGVDFHLAFIPEICDFGNMDFDFGSLPKIVGGMTQSCGQIAKELYLHVTNEVTQVSSAKVAEAAKILQNAYRLVNISFINEMKILLSEMDIDIWEVIAAASKKPFGFTPFYPGPGIGGDCIPVDPYYLVWKAKELGGHTSLIELAGSINRQLIEYITSKTIDALSLDGKAAKNARILILGVAFKKDVNDLKESCSLKIMSTLEKHHMDISYNDPYIKELIPTSQYPHLSKKSINLDNEKISSFDCVLILTDHSLYDWDSIGMQATRIVDTRNVMAPYPKYKDKVVKG